MSKYKEIKGFKVQTLATDTDASALAGGSWSAGGNMNTATLRGGGVGTQTAALSIAGVVNPNTVSGKTESYNGTAWTELGDLNTTRYIGNFVFGTQTAAIGAGGATGGPGTPTVAVVEQWNGSAWTEVGDLNKAKVQGGGSGTTSGGLIFGGFTFPGGPPTFVILAETETWNGSAWTEVNDLNAVRYTNTGSKGGSSTASITFGRATSPTAIVEKWDGTNWTEVGDLNSGRESIGGSGTSTDGLGFGGTPNTTKTEAYNGTSWTEVADLSVGRSQIGGTGASGSSALAFGGATPSESSATEEWTTSSTFTQTNLGQVYYNSGSNAFKVTRTVLGTGAWASGGNLNAAKARGGSAGIQTAALFFGGEISGASKSTTNELYNGSAWSEVADLNSSRSSNFGFGVSTSAVSAGGTNPAVNPPISTEVESWDGSSWTEIAEANTSRRRGGSAGTSSTSGFIFGGDNAAGTTYGIAETWNGTAWTEVANLNAVTSQQAGIGTATAALSVGGYAPPSNTRQTKNESWDGSSWTELADMNMARNGFGSAGRTTGAIVFGGDNPGGNPITVNAELWNGSSWTEVANISVASALNGGAGASNQLAINFGGINASDAAIVTTDEWTVPESISNLTITD